MINNIEFSFDLRNHPAYESIMNDANSHMAKLITELASKTDFSDAEKMIESILDAIYGETAVAVADAFSQDLRSIGYDETYIHNFREAAAALRRITKHHKEELKEEINYLHNNGELTQELKERSKILQQECLETCKNVMIREEVLMDFTGLPKSYFL